MTQINGQQGALQTIDRMVWTPMNIITEINYTYDIN